MKQAKSAAPAKPNLKKILESIEWERFDTGRTSSALPDDAITVAFIAAKATRPDDINQVVIRLGKLVIEELGWNTKDKIVPLHDKHNPMTMLLARTEAGTGCTLSKVNPGTGHRISFRWKLKYKLTRRLADTVEYHIKNKQLIIMNVGTS